MIIKNEYEIGDKVYFINTENRAQVDVVKAIHVFSYSDHVNINYAMEKSGETHTGDELFRSEAELKEDVFRDLLEFV